MNILKKICLKIRNKIEMDDNNFLEIGEKTRMKKNHIKIRGKNNRLIIGKNASLTGVVLEIRGENCRISIGDGTVIGKNTYISAKEVKTTVDIGENCMFSRNINLMTSDGHPIYKDGKRINEAKSIFVGDNVWLADDVILLKGSAVGSGSVVGIKSVITKRFEEENIVIVGNPGKKINEGVEWIK